MPDTQWSNLPLCAYTTGNFGCCQHLSLLWTATNLCHVYYVKAIISMNTHSNMIQNWQVHLLQLATIIWVATAVWWFTQRLYTIKLFIYLLFIYLYVTRTPLIQMYLHEQNTYTSSAKVSPTPLSIQRARDPPTYVARFDLASEARSRLVVRSRMIISVECLYL